MSRHERRQQRRLDQELDRLAQGFDLDASDSIEPELAMAANRLFGLYARQAAQPDDRFIEGLERMLMPALEQHTRIETMPIGVQARRSRQAPTKRDEIATRRSRSGSTKPRRWLSAIELTAVAAMLIALVGAAIGRDALLDPFRGNHAAVVPAGTSPEGMYRGNAARTGEMPGPGPSGTLSIQWRRNDQAVVSGWTVSPVLAGGTLYTAVQDPGNVVAIDAATGQIKWIVTVGLVNGSTPAVSSGLVIVAVLGSDQSSGDRGQLIALDAANGQETWRYSIGGMVSTSPAVENGTVYVRADDGTLRAVDLSTGKERWKFTIPAPDPASPQPGTTGKWAVGGTTLAAPAVANGLVYVASDDGILYAVDTTTGKQRWKFASDANFLLTPSVSDGEVVLVAELANRDPALRNAHGWVYALDAETGTQRWVRTEGRSAAPVAIADGKVYISGLIDESHSAITAVDAQTGDELWTSSVAGDNGSPPVVAGSALYATSDDGGLYAIDAVSGQTLWRLDLGSNRTSDPVVNDGRVIVAVQGELIAIGGSGEGTPTVSATPIVNSDISGLPSCTVQPRSESDMSPEGTPSAEIVPGRPDWENSTRQPILYSEIPPGQPVGQDVIDGILDTLHDIAVCDRPGYGLRLAALFSDDFLRRGPIEALFLERANGQLAQQMGAVDSNNDITTSLADVRLLPDGRVGVLLVRKSIPDNGEFTIFVHQGNRWLVDETRQVATTLDLQG